MDAKTLSRAMNIPLTRAEKWVGPLNQAMTAGNIDTRLRIAAFLAQIGHESVSLQYTKEQGGDRYLSKYDTGTLAKRLGNTPEADGDGQKYAGRGLIQVTGAFNYKICSQALFGDDRLLKNPELLEQPEHAAASAVWFWTLNGLNKLADAKRISDMTRKINGGLNGIEDRLSRWQAALSVLPA